MALAASALAAAADPASANVVSAFRGAQRRLAGPDCSGTAVCPSNFYCTYPEFKCKPNAAPGQECNPDFPCVDGWQCDLNNEPFICKQEGGEGGAEGDDCSEQRPCSDGLQCLYYHKCARYLKLHDVCELGGECDPSTYCSIPDFICKAKAKEWEECNEDLPCVDSCVCKPVAELHLCLIRSDIGASNVNAAP